MATVPRRRIMPMGGRRAKPRSACAVASTVALEPLNEFAQVAALVKRARSLLHPFAEIGDDGEHLTFKQMKLAWDAGLELGDYDGIGALLRVASIRLNADGSIAADEMHRFHAEGGDLMDQIQAQCQNFTIMFSIVLTITVALMTVSIGSNFYSSEVDATEPVHGFGDASASLAWSDFASWAWPHDPSARGLLRRAFAVCEAVFLGGALLWQIYGWYSAFALCAAFGSALPTVASKYDFLLDRPKRLTDLSFAVVYAMFGMIGALPFLLSRASAILGLCGMTVALIYMVGFVHSNLDGSLPGSCERSTVRRGGY
jgi:hypothetical protein